MAREDSDGVECQDAPVGAGRDVEDITPLWLSHHWPDDYDRCTVVGRRHVCRRCLVLYPVAIGVALLSLGLGVSDAGWAAVLFVLLPLPALGEVVAEQIGWLAPSPRRLVALTIPLGVGLGFGFARYLESPGDLLFWSVAIGYALVGLVALVLRWRHDARAADATAGGDAPGPPLTS